MHDIVYLISDKLHLFVGEFICCDGSQGQFKVFLTKIIVAIKILIKQK